MSRGQRAQVIRSSKERGRSTYFETIRILSPQLSMLRMEGGGNLGRILVQQKLRILDNTDGLQYFLMLLLYFSRLKVLFVSPFDCFDFLQPYTDRSPMSF